MKQKLLLCLILIATLFIGASCTNKKGGEEVKEEPKFTTVSKGFDNLEELGNYRTEIVLQGIYGEENSEDEFSATILQSGDLRKVQLIVSSFALNFYMVTEEESDYVLFAPSDFGAEYEGYVKATIDELKDLFIGSDGTSDELDISMLDELIDFLDNLQDSYFDLGDDEYYVFNQTGKDAIKPILENLKNEISGGEETIDTVDIDATVKIKTNKTYITNMKVELTATEAKVENGEEQTITMLYTFDRFGEVEIKKPTNISSFEDFMKELENNPIQ